MIVQKRTLIRARNLASFRRALAELALEGSPILARRRLVIVPTRASAELLRQTIESHADRQGRSAIVLPELATRDGWLEALATALEKPSRLLTRAEREVILTAAVGKMAVLHPVERLPFEPRPGLVAAMLDFYDELKRRRRNVRRFARALFDDLRVERGMDRGSEELIRLTRVLGFSYLACERAVRASGGDDEHTLRARLLDEQPRLPFDHLIVAVADHPSDPLGLWPADFDLLGRLRRLGRVDVVMTDEAHDAGFRARLEEELPGIEEMRATDAPHAPVLLVPASTDALTPPVFISRDREEELRDVARDLRSSAAVHDGVLVESVAVVFHRPLPYLYLAQQILTDARVPYQTFDALPLAAEPYAALLDLVLAVARTGGTREAAVALLRSRLVEFVVDGVPVSLDDASALDRVLAERRSPGDASEYPAEVARHFRADSRASARRTLASERAMRGAQAAHEASGALAVVRSDAPASVKVAALAGFLRRYERKPDGTERWAERHLRARAAVLGVLDELRDAFLRHGDASLTADDVTAVLHHALERQTFTPRRGAGGVHLVDAVAARFGEFDRVYLVGLSDTDWPLRPRRSIFYSSGLLKVLGWPQQADQTQAENAAFRDLLSLAAAETRLSAFQLEGDTMVAVSPMVAHARALPSRIVETPERAALFLDELVGLGEGAFNPDRLAPEVANWFGLRQERPALTEPAYSGRVDTQPARPYKVSRVDHYVDCPFRYFSENVLQLPEERDDEAGLTPLERGTLLHELFEQFYQTWEQRGGGAITRDNMSDAASLFADLVRDALAGIPEADRALEETRLIGSLVGRGVAERVFELEADSGLAVTRRLLETDLVGTFQFPVIRGIAREERGIEIRGKADRIDLLADGSLRVVDYKLGRMPSLDSSIQIAVYAHCARQAVEAADGQSHPVSAAMYLAFGEDRQLEGRLGSSPAMVQYEIETKAATFAATIGRIEAGEFPAKPRRPGDCQWCRYKGVCRKEYVGEIDQSADAV